MLWGLVLLLGVARIAVSEALTSHSWEDFTEKHSWVDVPRGWQHKAPAASDLIFELKLGLKQAGMDDLISNLMEISDPTHSRYAQHLSKEEVEGFVAPHPDSTQAVEDWLVHHGIDPAQAQRSQSGDWIMIPVSVAQAEKMLNTKYHVYQHGPSGEEVVRTLSYSLPQSLHSHIDVVAPTTYFGTLRSMKKTSFLQPNTQHTTHNEAAGSADVPGSCARKITPDCLRNLYNTSSYVPTATNLNTLGVAGYLDEFANKADLQTFFQRFRKVAVGSSFTVVQVHGGGDDQSKPGIEANLDIQYTTGISFPTPNIYYSTGGSPPFKPDSFTPTNTNEPYVDFLNFLSEQHTIPQVISTSYGDNEQTVPRDYAERVCNMLAQVGARGTTVFFSSGDYGVGADDCKANDGSNVVKFQPVFPASCPFVTAVGGTTEINPEVAVGFSGGGFSNYFASPAYQRPAVSRYLSTLGTTNAGFFNPAGRAYPDVAAQGQYYQVVIGGNTSSVAGTSASAPTVASIFSLLNDFRLSHKKTALGFINPLIYSTAISGFTDITSGSNPGCGTSGFPARRGWDPVTGLGTPNFLALQKLV